MRLDSPTDLNSRKCARRSRSRRDTARAAASGPLSDPNTAEVGSWGSSASAAELSGPEPGKWTVDIEMESVFAISDVEHNLFSLMFGKLINQILGEPE
jgi:hypothetical protein